MFSRKFAPIYYYYFFYSARGRGYKKIGVKKSLLCTRVGGRAVKGVQYFFYNCARGRRGGRRWGGIGGAPYKKNGGKGTGGRSVGGGVAVLCCVVFSGV